MGEEGFSFTWLIKTLKDMRFLSKHGALFSMTLKIRHDFLLRRLNFRRQELSAQYSNKEDLHNIADSAKEK